VLVHQHRANFRYAFSVFEFAFAYLVFTFARMCARYSLTQEQITILIGEVEVVIKLAAGYNIAPTQIVPAIWRSARGIEAVDMQWGFKSAWSQQPLINAKAETIASAVRRDIFVETQTKMILSPVGAT
jgi:hypothetical protein